MTNIYNTRLIFTFLSYEKVLVLRKKITFGIFNKS